MDVKGISWLGVRTEHFDEMVRFYGGTLGLPRVGTEDGFAAFELPNGDLAEVFAAGSSRGQTFLTGPVAGFEVDDIEQSRKELEASGIEFMSGILGDEGRWSHFRGPDGNVYELWQPGKRPPTPGMAAAGDSMDIKSICWLGVRTDRFDEMSRFYGVTLGLPRVFSEPGFVAFKLPNGDTIEVFSEDHPDKEHFTTGPVAGFEVTDIEQARRELEAAGIGFIGGIDGEDSRWSHFRAPDGNVYELAQPAT